MNNKDNGVNFNMNEVPINNNGPVDGNKIVNNYKSNNANGAELRKYKYKAKDQKGKIIQDTFEAINETQVSTFLTSQGLSVVNISEVREKKGNIEFDLFNGNKMNNKDLSFFLTQLSTYIKAGIPLLESMEILEKQTKNKKHKKVFKKIIFELNSGIGFSEALARQVGVFPKILINMVKTSELTGNLTEVLDDMAAYFTRQEKNAKEIRSAMTYPTVLIIFAVIVMTFMVLFIVPKFVDMYDQLGSDLPWITTFIINLSDFLGKNIIYIILGFMAFVLIFYIMYKNIKKVKYIVQYVLMHIPVISKVIISNEVAMFTSTFSSLIKHDVFITDSMEILGKVSDNEIYKALIKKAVVNLSSGNGISVAFENHWAFPDVAYQMLLTGEKTGKLGPMMENVADYYSNEQSNLVNTLKSLIEPVMIVVLAGIVGFVLLAVLLPMFNMYSGIM